MALLPQTSNFPPINQLEQSWEHDLRAIMESLYPYPRILQGLQLGLPATTPSLLPVMESGKMVWGDQVLGPYSANIAAAPASVTRYGIWFGLKGLRYLALNSTDVDPSDALLGEITTDANSVVSVVQYFASAPGRVTVRGVLNMDKLQTVGADVAIASVTMPDLNGIRIAHANARTLEVTATTTAGDQVVIKHGSTTLLTHNKAALDALNTVSVAAPGASEVLFPANNIVNLFYNVTRAGGAYTAGAVSFNVLLEVF